MEIFKLYGSILIKTEDAMNSISNVTKEAEKFADTVANKMEEAGNKMKNIGSELTSMGTKLTATVTAPIVAGFKKAVDSAASYDKTMQLVNATMNNSESQATMLGDAIMNAASKSTLSMDDAANAALNFARQGWTASEASNMIDAAMSLAVGTATDLDTVSSGLGNTLKAFGLSTTEATDVTNLLAKAQASANTTTEELFNAMGIAGPIFKTVGWDLDDLATVTGIFGDNSISASEGANALKTGVARLASAEETEIEVVDKAVESLFDENGAMKSCSETMSILHDAFAGLTDEQKIQAASIIFGKNQMAKWLVLIENGGASFDKLNASVKDNTGYCNSLSDALMQGLGGSIESLKASLDVMLVKAGSIIGEYLKPLIEKITELIDRFNALDKEQQTQILKWLAIAAAIGPVLIVVGTLFSAIGNILTVGAALIRGIGTIIGFVGSIGTVISSVVSWIGGLVTTISSVLIPAIAAIGPVILIVIAAVTALIAIGVLLYKNWDEICEWAKKLKENIEEAWDNIKESISNTWDAIKNVTQQTIDSIRNAISNWVDNVRSSFENMRENISNAMNNIAEHLRESWENIKQNVTEAITNIRDRAVEGWENIKSNVIDRMNAIKSDITNKWTEIKNDTQSKLENIRNEASSKFESIKNTLADNVSHMKSTMSEGFSSMVSSVGEKMGEIWDKIQNTFSNIINHVRDAVASLKNMFNFDWSLPKIKLPHFNMEGSFSLDPPSVPHISVDWYKNGGIMLEPTAFGINPSTGNVMAGGEAGPEAILPIDRLQEFIDNNGNDEVVSLLSTLVNQMSALQNALGNMSLNVNDREFARLVKAV